MSIVDVIMQDCEFDIIATDLARLKVKGLIIKIFDSAKENTSEFNALEEAIAGYEGASDTIDAHIADQENPHEITATQIGAAESSHTHSQYLTAETDPTVHSCAKAATKPAYSYSEISNTPTIPTALTDLSGTLPISQGGTNATNASSALSNLCGIPITRTINSKALSSDITLNSSDVSAAESTHSHAMTDIISGTLPINMGGTGATTASDAVENLGAVKFSNIVQQKIYTSSTRSCWK